MHVRNDCIMTFFNIDFHSRAHSACTAPDGGLERGGNEEWGGEVTLCFYLTLCGLQLACGSFGQAVSETDCRVVSGSGGFVAGMLKRQTVFLSLDYPENRRNKAESNLKGLRGITSIGKSGVKEM